MTTTINNEEFHDVGSATHTVQVVFTNVGGSVTALTVDLEGSLDGDTYFQLASHVLSADELTAQKSMFHVINKLVRHTRVTIPTLTDTGNTTLSIEYLGGA